MLEQMYLITVPKISVLGPNCWETRTEFSRHKNRTLRQVRLMYSENWVLVSRKFGSYMLHYGHFI